jgi:hypothetical protein
MIPTLHTPAYETRSLAYEMRSPTCQNTFRCRMGFDLVLTQRCAVFARAPIAGICKISPRTATSDGGAQVSE